MLNKFKYDYNNKLFFINILLSLAFLILSIIVFEKLVGFVLFLMLSILLLFNSFIIRAQGITINNKKNIIIVDQFFIRKLCVDNIKYVSLNHLPKKTKSKTYGFLVEFFYPYTYMSHCDYVYNQGKVYNICFHMKDGTILTSYFGWLYREKAETVKKVEKKLLNFIEEVNTICKKDSKKIN